MINFLYAEINIVGIILLLLFLNNMNRNKHRNISPDQFIFNGLMIMNILIFIFDTGMWLFNSKEQVYFIYLNHLATMAYYISNPFICLLWLMYTDYKIYESRKGLLYRMRFYVVPFVINAVLSIVSLYTGWLYIIDSSNNYMRGPYFPIMAFAALFYLVYSCIISLNDVIKNGWEENKNITIHLVFFPIGIIIASLIQIMFYGISIIWICAMLAFASIYINIQNKEISTDHLTGLYNRRRLDEYLQKKVKMIGNNGLLFAIILDLDGFKQINDKFGHAIGDQALINMAEFLRESGRDSDDFIARMGGDEFIVIGERRDPDDINKLINHIYSKAVKYNESGKSDYKLQPSMGYTVFKKDDTVDSFLAAADGEMYRNKQERKL